MTIENNYTSWKKNISLFMTSQAISLFGSSLVEFAIIWHITLTTKSGVLMTIGTLCVFLPRLFISLFAGVWADRHNRKLLIILSDGGIAFVTLLLAIVYMSGFQELWLIFLVLGIRSIGSGIQSPAISAVLPQIVPEDQLLKINGLNGSVQSIIMLISPAASAALFALMPLEGIFFIDVITAIIAIIIMLTIPIRRHVRSEENLKLGYSDDLKAGLKYSQKNIFVKEMLILYVFYSFLITPAAFLSPLAVARNFGDEVWKLSANEIAFSGGMMLGGAIIAWWRGLKNPINTIAMSCFVIGISYAVLGVSGFYVFLGMMFLMGIFAAFFNSVEMTLFQRKVEPDMQGRVFSLTQIVWTAVMPIGMLLFGPLGDMMDINYQFIICGILVTILGVYIYFNKRLKDSVRET